MIEINFVEIRSNSIKIKRKHSVTQPHHDAKIENESRGLTLMRISSTTVIQIKQNFAQNLTSRCCLLLVLRYTAYWIIRTSSTYHQLDSQSTSND